MAKNYNQNNENDSTTRNSEQNYSTTRNNEQNNSSRNSSRNSERNNSGFPRMVLLKEIPPEIVKDNLE